MELSSNLTRTMTTRRKPKDAQEMEEALERFIAAKPERAAMRRKLTWRVTNFETSRIIRRKKQ